MLPAWWGAESPEPTGMGPGGWPVAMFWLCASPSSGEWFLETEISAYDEVLGQRETPGWSPQILADIYRAAQRLLNAAEAIDYSRKAGRN